MHRHKLHDLPVGWGAMGPIECTQMFEAIKPMVDGEHGFGLTMTCRRDQLPKDVPSTYWHKERTDSSQRCKVTRFFNPVVSVKDVISQVE